MNTAANSWQSPSAGFWMRTMLLKLEHAHANKQNMHEDRVGTNGQQLRFVLFVVAAAAVVVKAYVKELQLILRIMILTFSLELLLLRLPLLLLLRLSLNNLLWDSQIELPAREWDTPAVLMADA